MDKEIVKLRKVSRQMPRDKQTDLVPQCSFICFQDYKQDKVHRTRTKTT